MTFPYTTAVTAGILLILQMALAFAVSGARGQSKAWVGYAGDEGLLRTIRRHANLAENAGLFVTGFALLELSKVGARLLTGLCIAFVVVRLFHVMGLSRRETGNMFRLVGGIGTYIIGFVLGGLLIWAGFIAALSAATLG